MDANTAQLLQRHILSVDQGSFRDSPLFNTAQAHNIVEALLPEAIERAKKAGVPLRIALYAHGGLVPESLALEEATEHIPWWVSNGVYPIYWIWHTGFLQMVGRLLESAVAELGLQNLGLSGQRDIADWTTDPLIEKAGRALGTDAVWGAMKRNAELACMRGGVAEWLTQEIKKTASNANADVQIHLIGHSAGCIFQTEFLRCLDTASLNPDSLTFLAPALRVDRFKQTVLPKISNGDIGHFSLFGLQEESEKNDNCGPYQKSILYFVSAACEREESTRILGLQEHFLTDSEITRAFVRSTTNGRPTAIWSQTAGTNGIAASQATSHVGFHSDAPTLNSVARRILGLRDEESLAKDFSAARSRDLSSITWSKMVDWPEEVAVVRVLGLRANPPMTPPGPAAPLHTEARTVLSPEVNPPGRRIAICVGIDGYRTQPLSYCVADSDRWQAVLSRRGFSVTRLVDGQATRANILESLQKMLQSAEAGDVVVFQFAGHGTSLPLAWGGETQPIVPYDGEEGALIFDYELKDIFDRAKPGVNVTSFMDCCHSETNSRDFMFAIKSVAAPMPEATPRFMRPTKAMLDAAKSMPLRHMRQSNFSIREFVPVGTMRNVQFAACKDKQKAGEVNGGGYFTLAATQVLETLIAPTTHRDLISRIATSMMNIRDQIPRLDCAVDQLDRLALEPYLPARTASTFDDAMSEIRRRLSVVGH